MNILVLSLPMGMMICLRDRPLVVILMCILTGVLEPVTVLWICLIFLFNSLGKFSLSLSISLTLEVKDTCAYKCLGPDVLETELILFGMFFPLFFEEMSPLTGMVGFIGSILENSTGLAGGRQLDFLFCRTVGTFVVNSFLNLLQNDFWPSPTSKISHPPLKIEETRSKATLPKPVKHGISSSLWLLRWRLTIKSEICLREILMLLTSISWVLSLLKRDVGLVLLSQELLLASWSSSYKSAGGDKELIACSCSTFKMKSIYVGELLEFKAAWAWGIDSLSLWEESGMWKISPSV